MSITYEQYRAWGYYAVDYQRLSQWQRWRGICSHRRVNGYQAIEIFWQWQIFDEEFPVYPFPRWLDPRTWRFGFHQTQNYNEFRFAFFGIVWWFK